VKQIPVALTIAGSDSGGGAGIQADLKTFASLAVHGTSVIACVTAQNPSVVISIQPCSDSIVVEQLQAVFDELDPAAVKTGMLYSASIIRTVAAFLKRHAPLLVVDPVMLSTSGRPLLRSSARKVLQAKLFPLATLLTPNLDEAELLIGRKLRSIEDLRAAARQLHQRFGCAALVKGGHLRLSEAADIFYDGKTELLLSAPFIRGVHTHGTGCIYSAAITAYLARGVPLPKAVAQAKQYITQAIAHSQVASGHAVLNSFWQ
jgi:hydroxymethylpyrimidine/phosphomethylpyrimidine kinase